MAASAGAVRPLVVHHLNNSRSQRILWLLEALGLKYDLKKYMRDSKTMRAPKELTQVHPLGKSPVLTDGDVVVAESGAIVEYVIGTYGQGRLIPPPGTPERLRYTFWLHFAEGSAMTPVLLALLFTKLKTDSPFFIRPITGAISSAVFSQFITPEINKHADYMESELGKTEWFAGNEFTAADIQMSFPVEAMASRGGIKQRCPKLMAWLDRIHAMPTYKRALEVGGPFSI